MYILYKATSPSGKIYIGYTKYKLEVRIKQHHSTARRGVQRPFCNAINKYGSKIKWEIINTYFTKEFTQNRECFFIKLYKSNEKEFGYNATSGGEGCLDFSKPRIQYIDNFGNIYLGSRDVFNRTGVKRCRLYGSVKYGYWCGKLYFSKYKQGMLSAIPREKKSKTERVRRIICYKNEVCFLSLKHAATFLNVKDQSIYRVVSGQRYSIKNFELRYIDDEKPHKKPTKVKKVKNGRFRKSIICWNTNIIYKNIDDLCLDMKLIKESVLEVCRKKRNSCFGFKFDFVTGGGLFQA